MLSMVQLLESMTAHMVDARSRLHRASAMFADTSQLLLIVSDGRCLGDRHKVKAAVRRAQDAQMFLVFIVLANPDKEVLLVTQLSLTIIYVISRGVQISDKSCN